jgi:hypothetical protein
MGKRDYRHREPKKPKKSGKRSEDVSPIPTPVQVEVIKKGKKQEEAE